MPAINIDSSVYSLADCTLEKRLSTEEIITIFAGKKVIICALRFIQFVVYSMRNPVVYRTAKKIGFC